MAQGACLSRDTSYEEKPKSEKTSSVHSMAELHFDLSMAKTPEVTDLRLDQITTKESSNDQSSASDDFFFLDTKSPTKVSFECKSS